MRAPSDQRIAYQLACTREAEINRTFLDILPTLTRSELARLIERRPHIWSRFAYYLPNLPEVRS